MPPPTRRRTLAVTALLAAGALVALVLVLTNRRPPPDQAAVVAAHDRGVGLMDRFAYVSAVAAFEEVVRLDPDRLSGRVNLGIALLNTATDANLGRATGLFEGVLRRE